MKDTCNGDGICRCCADVPKREAFPHRLLSPAATADYLNLDNFTPSLFHQ
jgi:hypothetical protein